MAGKALKNTGISLPFKLNLIVLPGLSKYHPVLRFIYPGPHAAKLSSETNFPYLYKAYPLANSSGNSFNTFNL